MLQWHDVQAPEGEVQHLKKSGVPTGMKHKKI